MKAGRSWGLPKSRDLQCGILEVQVKENAKRSSEQQVILRMTDPNLFSFGLFRSRTKI